MYFVVYLDENATKEKIYYDALLPVKIDFYLDKIKKKNQKVLSIILKEFPSTNIAKESIFLNFYDNCKRQTSFVKQGFLSINDLIKNSSLEYSLSIQGYSFDNNKNPYSILLDNELYIYATPKGSNIFIPTTIISNQLEFSNSINEKVSIDEIIYYEKIDSIISSTKIILKLGDSITISVPKKNDISQLSTNIRLTYSLRQIVIDLDFILNAINSKKFYIGKTEFKFSLPQSALDDFNVELQKKRLIIYREIVQLLEFLNIKDDLDLTNLTNKEVGDIKTLVDIFLHKENIKNIKVHNTYTIIHQKIANITLKLIIKELNKEKSLYTILDFFNANIHMSRVNENGDRYVISPFSALDKNDYITISNIDHDNILISYQNLIEINDRIYEFANFDMLNMLLAYDEKPNLRLFSTIKKISDWLYSTPNGNVSREITLLNHFQIIKRERELTEEEKSELFAFVEDASQSDDVKLASHLLLGNQVRAKHYFNKLDKKAQDNFKTYPIYLFWENI